MKVGREKCKYSLLVRDNEPQNPAERKKLLLRPRERLWGQLGVLNAYAACSMLHACCVGMAVALASGVTFS